MFNLYSSKSWNNSTMKLFLIVLSTYAFRFGLSVEVIPQNCLIWGPGLISKANLPVRYFYIQARDKSGNLLVLIAHLVLMLF